MIERLKSYENQTTEKQKLEQWQIFYKSNCAFVWNIKTLPIVLAILLQRICTPSDKSTVKKTSKRLTPLRGFVSLFPLTKEKLKLKAAAIS